MFAFVPGEGVLERPVSGVFPHAAGDRLQILNAGDRHCGEALGFVVVPVHALQSDCGYSLVTLQRPHTSKLVAVSAQVRGDTHAKGVYDRRTEHMRVRDGPLAMVPQTGPGELGKVPGQNVGEMPLQPSNVKSVFLREVVVHAPVRPVAFEKVVVEGVHKAEIVGRIDVRISQVRLRQISVLGLARDVAEPAGRNHLVRKRRTVARCICGSQRILNHLAGKIELPKVAPAHRQRWDGSILKRAQWHAVCKPGAVKECPVFPDRAARFSLPLVLNEWRFFRIEEIASVER